MSCSCSWTGCIWRDWLCRWGFALAIACRGLSRRGWIGGWGAYHRSERFDCQLLDLRYPALGNAEFDRDGLVGAVMQPCFDDGGLGLRQLAGEAEDLDAED